MNDAFAFNNIYILLCTRPNPSIISGSKQALSDNRFIKEEKCKK
jgi:hypothetical protein